MSAVDERIVLPDMVRYYTCEVCGGVFEDGWSDEKAKAEMHSLWGELPSADQAIVCEDCFQAFMQGMTN